MRTISLMNTISDKGTAVFDETYTYAQNAENPDAIMVRSADLHNLDYTDNLKAIARAGAGVNNIDLDECTKRGIAVFNTPGANANAVKELVIAGLLLASRDLYHGMEWVNTQAGSETLAKDVEKQKKKYAGNEIAGKSLGVIGLGAIGSKLANTALHLDMNVLGYDPYLSVDSALKLSRWINHKKDLKSLLEEADFVSLHLPLLDSTRGMINKETIAQMKDGVKILNFARGGLVNDDDILEALDSGKVALYVTDFPDGKLAGHPHVIGLPHLGASSAESEENCAVQAAKELRSYLEEGSIINSVNLPNVSLELKTPYRLGVIHENKPKVLSRSSDIISANGANIENLLNKSRGDISYSIFDLEERPSDEAIAAIEAIPEVIRVNLFEKEA
ncbi:3-phosphoglycerate dehydrogenase family protein [Allobaculum mucilyticum]|uniref:3-phosphoglycerate dehydrogenase family protein n=1 Tax=Allobaculum mucilyticum TaxID=2834459 RepID=UPI001E5275AD|nr:3-phosphoglycerate dehydrogenase family protein [Allobaculum mucilyticum]UNT95776.1 3-phosphoglycerate dehydrogenase [Allobaculum mucilyticum]